MWPFISSNINVRCLSTIYSDQLHFFIQCTMRINNILCNMICVIWNDEVNHLRVKYKNYIESALPTSNLKKELKGITVVY